MKRNQNLKFGVLILSVLISLLIAAYITINLLKVNLDSKLANFLSGFTFGLGIVFLLLLIFLSIKRVRDGIEIVMDDERNRMIKEKALTLSFKINMLLLLFVGLILWILNYDLGPVLVVVSIVQANIGLICWGIMNKIL